MGLTRPRARLAAAAACGLALAAGAPATSSARQTGTIQLVFRVFDGTEEVTAETDVRVYPTGKRDAPVPDAARTDDGLVFEVPPGIYDAQAIQQRDGQVVNIRWAERLVVMRYPDEAGRHLEVINFRRGFGALQIRGADGASVPTSVTVYRAGTRTDPIGRAVEGPGYLLLIVPAGTHDVVIGDGSATVIPDLEVPADRTRMRLLP